jgi:hypothetical protein
VEAMLLAVAVDGGDPVALVPLPLLWLTAPGPVF